jgi:hypothetical protein
MVRRAARQTDEPSGVAAADEGSRPLAANNAEPPSVDSAAEAAGAGARANDAPAMTLMTAAATREARAAARTGARRPDAIDGDDGDDGTVGAEGGDGRRAAGARGDGRDPTAPLGVSGVRPAAAMPLLARAASGRDAAPAQVRPSGPQGPNGPQRPSGPSASASAATRALELARPFLRLVDPAIGGDPAARAAAPRFYEQPQPMVSGAPSSDSASRLVEALRSQPAATASSDDRVSLADLTLIAIASATQKVAASVQGGGPSGGATAAAPGAAGADTSSAHGAGEPADPTQDIEELARAAFDELKRLITMARERSGQDG